MAYNTSGVYTRVDNSFSNPVVGTTISPTDADTYFDDIDTALNAYYGTSTSSVAIGTGSKVFTTQTGKLFGAGRFVVIRSDANAANYMFGQVTSYSSTTLTVSVISTGGSGTLADWTIYISGARGGAGPVAGIKQTYSTTTTDSDPGAGTFRLNNATISSVTAGYFDNVDADGATVSTIIDTWDDSTTTTKGSLRIEKQDDSSIWAVFSVTGSVTDGTGYRKLTLTYVAHGGTWVNGDTFRIDFSRSGDKGTDGAGSGDVTAAAANTADNRVVRTDGATGKGVQESVINLDDTTGTMYPQTNDSGALGKAAQSWADLFLASGGVVNWNNGNVTLTHAAGALTVAGATTVSLGTSAAFTTGTIELGAASDTTLSRSAAGILAVEGVDQVRTAGNQTLSGGFSITSYSGGSKTGASPTYTPAAANGNIQHITLNGSSLTGTFTIGVPSTVCSIVLEILNSGSGSVAASFSTSGYTKTSGDTWASTNGNKYLAFITKSNGYSHFHLQALQ